MINPLVKPFLDVYDKQGMGIKAKTGSDSLEDAEPCWVCSKPLTR